METLQEDNRCNLGFTVIKMSLNNTLLGSVEPFMVFNYAEAASRPEYVFKLLIFAGC